MKFTALLSFGLLTFCACNTQKENLTGTYKLLSSTVKVKGDTAKPLPMANQEMIKIFNGTHFAFFRHDLSQGKGADSIYDSGGGTYTLAGENYTEHLVYCGGRQWEGHDFNFTLERHGDSLFQKGVEKLEGQNIDREIVEIYVKKP
jgi:hypothetical protein